jgi:hypothetical protein
VVVRVLRLPTSNPENCGVTAIGVSNSVRRVAQGVVDVGGITVEILVPKTPELIRSASRLLGD